MVCKPWSATILGRFQFLPGCWISLHWNRWNIYMNMWEEVDYMIQKCLTKYTYRPLPSHKSQSGHLTAALVTASAAVEGAAWLSVCTTSSSANKTDGLMILWHLEFRVKPETDDMVRSVKAMIKRCIMVSRLVVGRLRCSGWGLHETFIYETTRMRDQKIAK